MSELETKAEAEAEEFNDGLSDEALDRDPSGAGRFICGAGGCKMCSDLEPRR